MCRNTKITYLLCLHTVSETHCSRSIFAIFFSACEIINSEAYINDFCPRCRQFWDHHSVSEGARRELVAEFRVEAGYHGPIMPSAVPAASGEVFFGFVKDEGYQEPARVNARADDQEEVRYMSELNARWEIDDMSSFSDVRRGKRRGSIDSVMTVFPGGKKEQKDGDSERLGPDDFGNDSDVDSDWSRGDGLIPPEEFDLEILERRLCGSEEESGTETGSEKRSLKLRPVAPMPCATPQRSRDITSPTTHEYD